MGLRNIVQQEDLNFLLTNRVPRIALTRLMGWFSQIRSPWLTRAAIAVWRQFTDLDLSDSRQQSFASLHECFTRQLVDGARPIDPDPRRLTSPCDAIVGACGSVEGLQVFQAKGYPYSIAELFGSAPLAEPLRDGIYATLRLTSAMYHRFHAPHDCEVDHVTHLRGDTWNVNPIALRRVEKLFCRNERAVLWARLSQGGDRMAIVPVAAILVAGIRLHFLNLLLHLGYRGPHEINCSAHFAKGQEMGWFEHGSTILLFAPRGFRLCEGIFSGTRIRVGMPLMQLPDDCCSHQTVADASLPGHVSLR